MREREKGRRERMTMTSNNVSRQNIEIKFHFYVYQRYNGADYSILGLFRCKNFPSFYRDDDSTVSVDSAFDRRGS